MSSDPCHALRIRLAGPPGADVLAARLAGLGAGRLWVDDVPAAVTDPAAGRRRAAELARPAASVRCVLLRYADGLADLVVVAPRSRPIQSLAAALLGRLVEGAAERIDLRPLGGAAAPPEWGLGDPASTATSTLHIALDPEADIADEPRWRRALDSVLGEYGDPAGSDGSVVGLLVDPHPLPAGGEYVPCLAPVFPFTVSVGRGPGGEPRLRCDIRHSHVAPAIAAQLARDLAHRYQQLRCSVAAAPADLSLPSADEQAGVAALGRPARAPVGTPARLHEAIRSVAAARPDAIALCDGDLRLGYGELDEHSDRLAGGLHALGVRRGDRVGICLERTAELVVTMLGVLKVGAAYVPMDPSYPAARLAHTAQDAELRVVVTRLPDFPGDGGIRVVTPSELLDGGAPAPVAPGEPDDPAYVIYTSGSTGRPKGVVVPHRNVTSLMDATRGEYGLGPDDVWTLFHSSAFDFSVWEIWGCLLTGGRLVVVPYDVSRDPDRFAELLVAEAVTVLSQTPSAFAQLVGTAHDDVAVRLVVFGGEPLDARMLLPWLDRHPEQQCRLVNMFGITETTVHVTAQTLTRAEALSASRSVGPALPGWHLYVMDAAGRLLPPGVPGEIYVGGAGVALGYLNRPELTAARFLPDPFTGGTMYRSGDRGRLLPDGRLEHLGRLDSQVKIRGFRIELDEIRAVLLEDPHVRAAAVVVRREDPADAATARLDAYVVLTGSDPRTVRRRAAGILPEHMVPATVTPLPALPLTGNGKLDPARLPAPEAAATPSATPAGNAPDGDLVRTLAEIWSEVLGHAVGLDDDFFELGGNSLLAVRINAAMRARDLPPLRLRDLFRHPSIRGVLRLVGDRAEADDRRVAGG